MRTIYDVPDEVDDELSVPQGGPLPAGWKMLEKRVKERGEYCHDRGLGHWHKNGMRAVHTRDGVVAMKSWVDFSGTIPVRLQVYGGDIVDPEARDVPGGELYAVEPKIVEQTIGLSIHFDCKKVAGPSMPLKESNFHKKQKKQLFSHASAGACCFLLLHFNRRVLATKSDPARTWAIPIHPDHPFWMDYLRGHHGMLSRGAAESIGVSVKWDTVGAQRTPRPDILTAVQDLQALGLPVDERQAPF